MTWTAAARRVGFQQGLRRGTAIRCVSTSKRAALFHKKPPPEDPSVKLSKPVQQVEASKDAFGSWAERAIPEGESRLDGLSASDLSANSEDLGSRCLQVVQQVFEHLREDNPRVEVTVDPGKSVQAYLPDQDVLYLVQLSSGGEVSFLSPVSGTNSYKFSPKRESWVSLENGHDFEGLLTRDLMRYAYGVPKFSKWS